MDSLISAAARALASGGVRRRMNPRVSGSASLTAGAVREDIVHLRIDRHHVWGSRVPGCGGIVNFGERAGRENALNAASALGCDLAPG